MPAATRLGAALLSAGLLTGLTAGPALAAAPDRPAAVAAPARSGPVEQPAPLAQAVPLARQELAAKSSGPNVFLMIGGGLVIGVGYGFFMAKRNKRQK